MPISYERRAGLEQMKSGNQLGCNFCLFNQSGRDVARVAQARDFLSPPQFAAQAATHTDKFGYNNVSRGLHPVRAPWRSARRPPAMRIPLCTRKIPWTPRSKIGSKLWALNRYANGMCWFSF